MCTKSAYLFEHKIKYSVSIKPLFAEGERNF